MSDREKEGKCRMDRRRKGSVGWIGEGSIVEDREKEGKCRMNRRRKCSVRQREGSVVLMEFKKGSVE